MTLPGPGTPLTMAQINAEFGYGFDLNSYRGKIWFYDNGTAGIFPLPPNPISFLEFYSKRSINPVVPTIRTYTSNGTFTVPAAYTTMVVTVKGGGGGAGGYNGYINCGAVTGATTGEDGVDGGASSFSSYASATGGTKGTAAGVNGTNGGPNCDGVPLGGIGSNGGGSGGAGGYMTVILISPAAGGTGPNPGAILPVVVGSGGAGGKGGPNSQIWSGACTVIGYASSGQSGGQGSVTVQWS